MASCRLTVDESEVAIEYDPAHPVAVVRRAEATEFWARSRGRVTVVIAADDEETGPSVDCVEATEAGGVAALELPAGRAGDVQLFVATRWGEQGGFVAGLRPRGATAPDDPVPPPPARAPNEAEVSWRLREVPCDANAEGGTCADEELRLEGAFEHVWQRRVEYPNHACRAEGARGGVERFGFSCGMAIWRTVSLRREGASVVVREAVGTDTTPRPRARVLHRVNVPPGVRLVGRRGGLVDAP